MKNNLSILLLLVLLASGCTQDEMLTNQSAPIRSPKFTASFEGDKSRTYVEENNLLRWTSGDQIALFVGNTLNRQYQFDGETGDNSGTFSIVDSPFGTGNDLNCHYAVYPYASNIKITEKGVVTAVLPEKQKYAENSFGVGANTMVAVTKDTDDTYLKFKNVGGYLKLQLYGDDVTVKTITLKGNAGEKIAGKAVITPSYAGDPTVSMAEDAVETITLDCGEGVKIGATADEATAFWIVVPPVSFERGFVVSVTDVNGVDFVKFTSKEVVIERNVINPMAAFEVERISDNQIWYTSLNNEIVEPNMADWEEGIEVESNEMIDGRGVITFNQDITSIAPHTFMDNTNLTSVVFPETITALGNHIFFGCENLLWTRIPSKVETIGPNVFFGCESLTSMVVPEGVTRIEESTFNHCFNLRSVILPESLTFIGYYAFHKCYKLEALDIPDNVTEIWEGAFDFCESLTSLVIPDGVTYIDSSVFNNCCNLTSITIPEGVTVWKDNLFLSCTSLTSITIPSTVTNIECHVFVGCSSLKEIHCQATEVPGLDKDAFTYESSIPSDVTLYVPKGCKEKYESAENWKNFAKIVEE